MCLRDRHVLDYLGSRDICTCTPAISHMGVACRGVHMTSSRMYVRRPGSRQSIRMCRSFSVPNTIWMVTRVNVVFIALWLSFVWRNQSKELSTSKLCSIFTDVTEQVGLAFQPRRRLKLPIINKLNTHLNDYPKSFQVSPCSLHPGKRK